MLLIYSTKESLTRIPSKFYFQKDALPYNITISHNVIICIRRNADESTITPRDWTHTQVTQSVTWTALKQQQ